MKLETFMDNIEFVFCDSAQNPNAKDLFIQALHEGICFRQSDEEMNKLSILLEDTINIAPIPLLAKHVGNGVEVYYRSSYLLNFEYNSTHETWGFYIDFDKVDREGLTSIPVIFMLFYNSVIDLVPEYKSYPKMEKTNEHT